MNPEIQDESSELADAGDPAAGMTREMRGRAIAVMKDVLVQLDADRLLIDTGNYVTGDGAWLSTLDLRDDLKAHIDAVQTKCSVCMMGAALLSRARLYDAVPMASIVTVDDDDERFIDLSRRIVIDHLRDVFTPLQLDLLEAAFERWIVHGKCENLGVISRASSFGLREGSAGDRARAIAENVVANDGVFIPSDE